LITTKILNNVNDLDIFAYYLGYIPELQKMYPSPFRVEKNPSFNIYINPQGHLRYKDFGHSQGSAVDFVMLMLGLNYAEASNKIYYDVGHKESLKTKLKKKQKSVFKIIKRPFNEHDKEYWSSQGIELETLVKYNVVACSLVYVNGDLWFVHDNNHPTYAYQFNDKVKIYRPFAKKKGIKFIGNVPNQVPQGFDQLPKSNSYLIITKSLKDVMFFYEAGMPAIAPHGEDMPINEEYLEEIKLRFPKLIVIYDNDAPGVKGSIKLTQNIGAEYWNIPRSYDVKDITDFYKKYGKEKTIELLESVKEKIAKIS
jgi:hypothetical protein